jgi:hypothetical protein
VLVTHTATTTEGTTTMSTSTLAYSSSTGTGTTYIAPEHDTTPAAVSFYEDDEYCSVCGRCTNHVGEHEDLVAAGLAEYEGGNVHRTTAYDADRAREISEAGFQAYMVGPVAYEAFCQGLEDARA